MRIAIMSMTRTINIKKFLGFGLFAGLFLFIISYSIFQTKAISRGVTLNIANIKDGEVSSSGILTLTGTALHATYLSVNNKEIVVDEKNGFSEELVLSDGYNIITIEAKDKFGKATEKSFRVLYQANDKESDVASLPD